MKIMRKAVCAAATTFFVSTAHAGGIPVIDIASIQQAILMVQSMKQQYDQLKSQYDAVVGNRGLGQILNNPALRNYLPDQWQSIYDLVKSGQLGGITGAANQILQQEGLAGAFTPGQQRYNDVLAANKAMAMQAYDATIKRLDNIKALMAQSDLTQDPAAKADLQNRWSAEYTMVQNEQTRLNLAKQLQESELKLADEQRHREFKNKLLGIQQ
ncbi:P-type DNA transfer protein VirB5 [Burkholderia ubonensis]|uniref:P-type DNA transfer protein VirB5 n=1 Tax=Burkholderia ubonensis TaxID=101571 RepID=UPI0007585C7A|nr:P-type DNA transfer protein VirB5 [Burkholderia ubonensis]KVW77407.1 haloacid dehalogenase [Burkholderia ubonensis]